MVTAIQWLSPQAICFILRPCNASIGRGVNKSLELPWPNLPKSPLKNYKKQKLLMIGHRSLTLLTSPNWQINHGRKVSSWWDGKHFRVARYRRQNIISSQTLDTMTFHIRGQLLAHVEQKIGWRKKCMNNWYWKAQS